jgi:hypothetical protein
MSQKSFDWTSALFCLAVALLLGHELDAVARAEWNLLPILDGLEQTTAERAFVLLHIPLVWFLLWAGFHRSDTVRRRTRLGVCGFLVIHGGLHAAMSGHAQYAFEPPVETITVYGAAAVSAVYLVLAGILRR